MGDMVMFLMISRNNSLIFQRKDQFKYSDGSYLRWTEWVEDLGKHNDKIDETEIIRMEYTVQTNWKPFFDRTLFS